MNLTKEVFTSSFGKLILVIVITFLTPRFSIAQTSLRSWEEGALTWNDFKGKALESSTSNSEFAYTMSYATHKEKFADTALFYLKTENQLNQNITWVKEAEKSDELLKYYQVLFNLVEVYRRKLQIELNRIDKLSKADLALEAINEELKFEIRRYEGDTENPSDSTGLEYWDKKVSDMLLKTPLEKMPQLADRNLGYGINAGIGAGGFSGSIADHFTQQLNFTYGFDCSLKNTSLLLNGSLGGNRIVKNFTEENQLWPKGKRSTVAIIEVSIGQSIINSSKHKLTPYAGFALMEFIVNRNYQDFSMVNYGLSYGLIYDFKMRKSFRIIPASYTNSMIERAEHNLRIRLFASPISFENIKGQSINLSIGYSLNGRLIKTKELVSPKQSLLM